MNMFKTLSILMVGLSVCSASARQEMYDLWTKNYKFDIQVVGVEYTQTGYTADQTPEASRAIAKLDVAMATFTRDRNFSKISGVLFKEEYNNLNLKLNEVTPLSGHVHALPAEAFAERYDSYHPFLPVMVSIDGKAVQGYREGFAKAYVSPSGLNAVRETAINNLYFNASDLGAYDFPVVLKLSEDGRNGTQLNLILMVHRIPVVALQKFSAGQNVIVENRVQKVIKVAADGDLKLESGWYSPLVATAYQEVQSIGSIRVGDQMIRKTLRSFSLYDGDFAKAEILTSGYFSAVRKADGTDYPRTFNALDEWKKFESVSSYGGFNVGDKVSVVDPSQSREKYAACEAKILDIDKTGLTVLQVTQSANQNSDKKFPYWCEKGSSGVLPAAVLTK